MKQPFKATGPCQVPQLADIWPSSFGHWPSSVDPDTHMAISQSECLAVLNPGLPSFSKHSIWRQHGDRSRVDGKSFPLAFCLMNSMPSFCGNKHLTRRPCPPQNRRWWTWSSPHWCDKGSTSAVLPLSISQLVSDHQPSDYAVRSHLRSSNQLCSQVHSLLRENISYYCSDDCLAHDQDNFVTSWPFPGVSGW